MLHSVGYTQCMVLTGDFKVAVVTSKESLSNWAMLSQNLCWVGV